MLTLDHSQQAFDALVHRSFTVDARSIVLFDDSIASNPEAYEVAYRRSMLG